MLTLIFDRRFGERPQGESLNPYQIKKLRKLLGLDKEEPQKEEPKKVTEPVKKIIVELPKLTAEVKQNIIEALKVRNDYDALRQLIELKQLQLLDLIPLLEQQRQERIKEQLRDLIERQSMRLLFEEIRKELEIEHTDEILLTLLMDD